MNIHEKVLEFINSRDIAEHLRNIGYKFTAQQAAFLIHKSNKQTLDAKISAWEQVVAELDDCSMAERANMEPIESFHAFLERYIALQGEKLKAFYDGNGAVYFYTAQYKNFPAEDRSRLFSSFEKCFEVIKDEFAGIRADISELEYITVTKSPLDRDEYNNVGVVSVTYNSALEILSVSDGNIYGIDDVFRGMWFDFPTPFKQGDILIERNSYSYGSYIGTPFVLHSLCTEWDKVKANLEKNGDSTDMSFLGYYAYEGDIFKEHGNDYISLEYYREPLKGEQRFLKALGMHMKGELDYELLFKAKDVIYAENELKEKRRRLGFFTDEICSFLGFGKE